MRFVVIFLLLILLLVVLPNIINTREKEYFTDERRIARVIEQKQNNLDSIEVVASPYYDDKSELHYFLFGEKYRDIWNTKIKVPVFKINDSTDQYTCVKMGGGMQSFNIDITDHENKVWTLRSIDKDQSKALNPLLQQTILRPIVRDEVAAMNPYGAFVVDDLSEAAGIPHTNPTLVFVPYLENLREDCRERMAGRLALLEEELDEPGWHGDPRFYTADIILDTEDMIVSLADNLDHSIDTLGYLRARLFDILISDWDRHEGQWAWALKDNVFHPIPIDRDMVFYLFDDGWINRLFLLFNDKFQSFHPNYQDVSGYVHNSQFLDIRLLKNVPEKEFTKNADLLQQEITNQEIEEAFKEYPPPVYNEIGQRHEIILKQRLSKLEIAAKNFFAAIQENNH